MTEYKEIQDMKILKPFAPEFIETQKQKTVDMVQGAKEAKLVCISMTFITDNEISSDYKLISKNYNEEEWS